VGRICLDAFANSPHHIVMCHVQGVDLTPELWLVKLLCGAIDPSYDEQDE
jgi:hypothetical protein